VRMRHEQMLNFCNQLESNSSSQSLGHRVLL
jgi:hypothetical protein